MKPHYHATVEHILLYGVSAIIVINLWRVAAAWAGTKGGAIGTIGHAAGTLTTFGGSNA